MADQPRLVLLFADQPEHYVNNSSSSSSINVRFLPKLLPIIFLKVKKSIFSLNQLTLHVICDVIGIAQHFFLKSKMAAKYFAPCQNLKFFLVHVRFKTLKTEPKRI